MVALPLFGGDGDKLSLSTLEVFLFFLVGAVLVRVFVSSATKGVFLKYNNKNFSFLKYWSMTNNFQKSN